MWEWKKYDGDVKYDDVDKGYGYIGMMNYVIVWNEGKNVEEEEDNGKVKSK